LGCRFGDEDGFVLGEGGIDGGVEGRLGGVATFGQVGVLDRAEDVLNGVEFGRGRGQVVERQPAGDERRQGVAEGMTVMTARVVQHDHQRPTVGCGLVEQFFEGTGQMHAAPCAGVADPV